MADKAKVQGSLLSRRGRTEEKKPPEPPPKEPTKQPESADHEVSQGIAVRELPPLDSLTEIPEPDEALQKVETLAEQAGILQKHINQKGGLMLQMRQSHALRAINDLLTDKIMDEYFMPWQGHQLGFKTDRPYSREVVRRCATFCLINGARITGNEMNILGGGNKNNENEANAAGFAYLTVEYYERMVLEIEGVRDLSWNIGVPEIHGPTATVQVFIRFTYQPQGFDHAVPYFVDQAFPVRHNQGAMATAAQSKARRAGLKMIYKFLVGSKMTPPEGEVEEPVEIGGRSGSMADVAAAGDQVIPWESTLSSIKKKMDGLGIPWREFIDQAASINGGQVDVKEIPIGLLPKLLEWSGERIRDAMAAKRAALS